LQKSSVNKVILVGRTGADIELKYTANQVAIANVSLATTESMKDAASGEYQDNTDWHKLVAFGKTAEFMNNYTPKGSLLAIEGRLQTRSWTDKEENKRYSTEIVVNSVTPLGPKPKTAEADADAS